MCHSITFQECSVGAFSIAPDVSLGFNILGVAPQLRNFGLFVVSFVPLDRSRFNPGNFEEATMRTLPLVMMLGVVAVMFSGATSSAAPLPVKKKAVIAAPAMVKSHRVLIQVDQNDPAVMNLALNNATNIIDYYRAKGEEVNIDLVTYGPGLNMLRADTSPVQDRVKSLKDYAFPSKIQFSACNNTKEGMEKKEGHPISLVSQATLVPAGVVHLMELQEKGWSYIRP